jgi:L-lactate utilization protein LutB
MDSYANVASQKSINATVASLKANGFLPEVVETKEAALAKIIELIPEGSSIMNGSSVTLQEIGFIDHLKDGGHKWNNLHETILAETDQQKQLLLRRQSVVSDYYAGSAHAVTETGEIMVASNTGSQLPHLVYTSPNIVIVIGAQKIVPSLDEAFKRLETHVIPLEDERMKKAYGVGTTHAKTLILHKENPFMGRKIHVVIVNEVLGY